MKIQYVAKRFSQRSRRLVEQANDIIEEYEKAGYVLTLRQLYYQFVARALIPNKQVEYKRLGAIINDARLAGLIDWEAIEDRTRSLEALAHWEEPSDILEACAKQYREDKWAAQGHRVEVWVEKEALAGVFAGVCRELDVPYLCCRGYTSQSEMWRAATRLREYELHGQETLILHFGDHDPSGIDMSRDIEDRLRVFGCTAKVKRVALTLAQISLYKPPPNPAKSTDSRFESYTRKYGNESWELDALDPAMLTDLVRKEVRLVLDTRAWGGSVAFEAERRSLLAQAAERWNEVCTFLSDGT